MTRPLKGMLHDKAPSTGITSLRGKIITPMTEEEIDNQLQKLKAEWERDFF